MKFIEVNHFVNGNNEIEWIQVSTIKRVMNNDCVNQTVVILNGKLYHINEPFEDFTRRLGNLINSTHQNTSLLEEKRK